MLDRLKIIASEQIIPFEYASDIRSAELAGEISHEGRLKNPLLVYPLEDKYLMLDDASLLAALISLEITHIPVQLADLDGLSVHPWQRVVEDWHISDLVDFCRKFPRQIHIIKAPTSPLGPGEAEVRFRDKTICRLAFRSGAHCVRADMCARLCGSFEQSHRNYRAKLNVEDPDPLRGFPKASAAVFPPVFTVNELAAAAARNALLPHGIVRIDQPGRVLGVDYLLSILKEKVDAYEKEAFLRQLIQMRMSSDRTAYYSSGVFMFNN